LLFSIEHGLGNAERRDRVGRHPERKKKIWVGKDGGGFRGLAERGRWIGIGLTLVALAGGFACGDADRRGAVGEGDGEGPPRAVRTAAVVSLAPTGGTAPGTVVARQRAVLAARIAASVVELPFREGETVRAGAVVVRLDDDALRAALAAAESGAAAAAADRERLERLLARAAATPREAEAARARAAAAGAELAAARDALHYSTLRAPFAGRVARRLVRKGDVAGPGQPLVELEGTGGFELRAAVDGGAASALAPGVELEAEVDGLPASLAATVRAVTPAADPGTHRFEVVADLPSAPGLRSGLFARLALPPAGAAGVAAGTTPGETGEPSTGGAELAVPAVAAFARGGLTGVFVAEGDRARLRWIAPGERRGDLLVVRAGLEPGEQVVLDPGGLVDGARIAPQAVGAQPPPSLAVASGGDPL
jgi:RND family efflux transporter MFP subunit